MRKQLTRWLSLLWSSCGASVKAALQRVELEPAPKIYLHVCSDAMYEPSIAGIGGYCHGFYWSFAVPAEALPVLSIPILEFLGVVFNFLVFAPLLRRLLATNPNAAVVLRTDALTAALTLPAESQDSPLLVAAFQWLRERPEFAELAPFCLIAHLFGDANPYSDALSRRRWAEFRARCRQLGMKPTACELPAAAHEVFALVVRVAEMRVLRAGGLDFLARRFGAIAAPPPSPPLPPPSRQIDTPQASGFLSRRFAPPAPPADRPTAAGIPTPRQPAAASPARVGPTLRRAGALVLPRAPPSRPAESTLAAASRHYARARVEALACRGDDESMTLRGNIADLVAVGAVVDEYVEFGVNAKTAQKDARAWEFWEVVCEAQGTSPLRTPDEVRDHPERQSHLLAALLMYAFAVCEPKDRTRRFVKPRSALAYPLAIIRIFGRWGIVMPGYKALVAALNGLMRLYISYHGPHSLAPRRAEPMKFSMMRDIYHAAPSAPVGGRMWTDADHDVFIFVRLNVFLMYTAFRLGEIVAHRSGEIMFITYACLVWCICGVIVVDPTPAQLRALRPGLDYALVAPPRSKPDQWGEIHCPFPVTLTFNTEPDNPAAALRDIELRCPCHGAERQARPLFGDASGSPYSHAFLSAMLKAILTYLHGAAVASLFTFHSYRSGLAKRLWRGP